MLRIRAVGGMAFVAVLMALAVYGGIVAMVAYAAVWVVKKVQGQ